MKISKISKALNLSGLLFCLVVLSAACLADDPPLSQPKPSTGGAKGNRQILLELKIFSLDEAKARTGNADVDSLLSGKDGGKVLSGLESSLLKTLLEKEGKEVAHPFMLATEGRRGSFVLGGEAPILVPGKDGTAKREYRSFGHKFGFRATIAGDTIRLEVSPSFTKLVYGADAVQVNGQPIPAFAVRQAQFTVEPKARQTVAVVVPPSEKAGKDYLVYLITPEVAEASPVGAPVNGVGRPQFPDVESGPVSAKAPGSEKPLASVKDLRELRAEVRLLRRDVAKLIEMLEKNDR